MSLRWLVSLAAVRAGPRRRRMSRRLSVSLCVVRGVARRGVTAPAPPPSPAPAHLAGQVQLVTLRRLVLQAPGVSSVAISACVSMEPSVIRKVNLSWTVNTHEHLCYFRLMALVSVVLDTRVRAVSPDAVRGAGVRSVGASVSVTQVRSVIMSPGTVCHVKRAAGGPGVGRPVTVTRRALLSALM